MTTDNQKYLTPTIDECLKTLADYNTPDHVIGHCKAVAVVGEAIAKAINERRLKDMGSQGRGDELLDADLVLTAGLLHDMARVEDKHWEVAADYCLSKGWVREAEIIRLHMTYDPFNEVDDFNETDVVCLADRLVIENRYAGLGPRMDYIIEKARRNGNDEYVPHILRKKKEVGRLIESLEKYLGKTIGSLMENIDYMDNID